MGFNTKLQTESELDIRSHTFPVLILQKKIFKKVNFPFVIWVFLSGKSFAFNFHLMYNVAYSSDDADVESKLCSKKKRGSSVGNSD